MNLLFKSVSLDTLSHYRTFWKKTPVKSSDYSIGVLLCWARAFGYELAFEDDEELVWIKGSKPDDHCLAPVGRWDHPDWEEILLARFGVEAEFRLVPEALVDIWRAQMGDAVHAVPERGSWEYLHSVSELAELAGNKYMRKRNRINQFIKQTPYTYLPITDELIPRIAEFQQTWCESYKIFHGAEGVCRENRGIIADILPNWSSLPELFGGAIEAYGRIIAYTIAEVADDETIMIHVEKASLEHNAAYQVISKEFLRHDGGLYKTVNREEDMGDISLRDAKMSYHPSDFIKKYTVTVKL